MNVFEDLICCDSCRPLDRTNPLKYVTNEHLVCDMCGGEFYLGKRISKEFRIICLRRSHFSDSTNFDYTSEWYYNCKLVYWKPNFRGYTTNIKEAGHYSLKDLDSINGKFMDWVLEPIWRF